MKMQDTSGFGVMFTYTIKVGSGTYEVNISLDEVRTGEYVASCDFYLDGAGDDSLTGLGEQYKVLSSLFYIIIDAMRNCDDKAGRLVGLHLMCREKAGDGQDKNARLKLYQNAIDTFAKDFGVTTKPQLNDRREGWLNFQLSFSRAIPFTEILQKY